LAGDPRPARAASACGPQGFGVYHGKKKTAKAETMLRKIPIGDGGDGLLKAAVAAVKKLGAAKPV
jgi:hypothetical protein